LTGRRIFLGSSRAFRARRATDGFLLAWSLLGTLGLVGLERAHPAAEQALTNVFAAMPGWFAGGWQLLADLAAIWALLLALVALFERRFAIVGSALVAVASAAALAAASARMVSGDWPALIHLFGTNGQQPSFPAVRLGVATAVVVATAADTALPVRRTGTWMIGLGALGTLVASLASPFGCLAALLIGSAGAACARLAFGTSAGQPSTSEIRAALAGFGVRVGTLEPLARQPTGVFALEGADEEGLPLLVRVYGRDAYDNQLLARAWRVVFYREQRPAFGGSRAGAVEKEALITYIALQAGVPTWPVIAVGRSRDDDGVIALRPDVRDEPLAGRTTALEDATLASGWEMLVRLHAANCVHGRIDPTTLLVGGGVVKLVDWTSAVLTPTDDQRLADRAALLAVFACAVGVDRSIASAVDALGGDEITRMLPFLQTAAFDSELRLALKDSEIDVDELRAEVARSLETEPPKLVQLRRVTWGTVIQLALLVLAGGALIGWITNLDLNTLLDEWRNASWGWLIAGFVLAQVPRLTQAVTTLASVPAVLPYFPVYIMQLATGFMNLALPSAVARMAVDIRFFQRLGIPPAAAVTASLIDSFVGNAVQVLLLILLLVLPQTSSLQLDANLTTSGSDGKLIALLLVVAAAAIGAVFAIGRFRRPIAERIDVWWPQVKEGIHGLRGSGKLVRLFGATLTTELLFAAALFACTRGFGAHIPYVEILLINLGVSLFSSLIPIPGGIGVTEGALMVGLTSAGMGEEAAFAATITFRLSTFYVPPTWGWFALSWLRRNSYL
jgi:uncharacterized membrane protein YbhN (UPF0104 family)